MGPRGLSIFGPLIRGIMPKEMSMVTMAVSIGIWMISGRVPSLVLRADLSTERVRRSMRALMSLSDLQASSIISSVTWGMSRIMGGLSVG